ncbi:uncharacterized protein LOC121861250 [Homarus americanus]|uniref:uncharacterized protein LOC121861250 n=1 Tax=Homarus americanus TaxID=6706 RepID=UPI001C47ACC2|nr:uncharacterized protein LOC121861250 [Homarus americanus]
MEKLFLPLSQLLLLLLHGCSGLWLGECNKPLGVSTGELLDSALTASSAHDNIVGPHRARLGMEGGGGAWCPRSTVDARQKEWLEVDLGASRLVTAVATQGRHANGQGMEYTPAYTLTYWRPGMTSFTYYSANPSNGNKCVSETCPTAQAANTPMGGEEDRGKSKMNHRRLIYVLYKDTQIYSPPTLYMNTIDIRQQETCQFNLEQSLKLSGNSISAMYTLTTGFVTVIDLIRPSSYFEMFISQSAILGLVILRR